MVELAVGDNVVVYTPENGLRTGVLVAMAGEDARLPMHTVKIEDSLWVGPELHVFPADTPEETAQQEVDERLATYGQELAARRVEREARLDAQLAAQAAEAEEEETEATETE